ncbi:MAG: hypothetical protein LJE67_02910 [Salaquimonas sp.]|nr:hypothetical protein [Salaquimonas sp.]
MIKRKRSARHHPSMLHVGFRVPRRYGIAKISRVLGATLAVLLLASVMSAAGLYFLLRGESLENSTLNQSIETNIQRFLGPDYVIDLGRTAVAFDGLLSVASTDVHILRAVDHKQVSTLGRVLVGVRPLSLLYGEPQIDSVVIEDSVLEAGLLPIPANAPVHDIDTALRTMGKGLASLGSQFASERFRLFRFSNVRVSGLGKRGPGEVLIKDLEVRFRRDNGLKLEGELATTHSRAYLDGSYSVSRDGSAMLDFDASGIGLRDWLPDPLERAKGPIGWDGKLSARATLVFAPDGEPQEPEIKLSVGHSTLRAGRYATTTIKDLQLNLRLMPSRNQIELVPSLLSAGNFNARLIGGVRPVDEGLGYAGPLQFELIADPAAGTPTFVGETSQPGAIRLSGTFDRKKKLLDIPTIEARIGKDQAVGSASIGFGGETPSIAAAAASDGLSIAAIKQFWPYWIAPPARKWALRNVIGGRATSITIDARIPSGIVGRFRQGKKMKPEEFKLHADFSGVRLDTFGELPAIRNAAGSFDITGMTASAHINSGRIFLPDDRTVEVSSGDFRIGDFGERPAHAEVHIAGDGELRAVAEIAAARPLDVPARVDMRAGQLSGKADVDVVARFPLTPKIDPKSVEWSAILELDDAASSKKIQGHAVANGKLHIEATPKEVRIKGTAAVDGITTRIAMTEPVGNSGVKSEREFTALVDEKARAKMGLDLGEIITGNMEVQIKTDKNGAERQVIDLKDAELNLPWIGWTKGQGIEATASFKLRNKDGTTHLDDFYLEGEGFSAVGSLAFDKKGIVSADLANVTLNEGDLLSVQLKRKGKTYNIRAEGQRYDARGLINKLIHEGGFVEAQGSNSIVLTANIGTVRGFGGRSINGVSMSYGAVNGWFDNLSLRGTFSQSEYVSLVASTSNKVTTFEVDTTDAGATLGMVDVYRHMSGGRMLARLTRTAGGPFKGPVNITNFLVEDEPRLKSLVSDPSQIDIDRGANADAIRERLSHMKTNRAHFQEGKAVIEKGGDYFRVTDGVLRGTQIGFTFDGLLYDPDNHMSLSGTFMPGMGISRAIGLIPVVGELFGNGRDTSLIGITFRLTGLAKNPTIEVNPVSIVAPGVFRKVFEFSN